MLVNRLTIRNYRVLKDVALDLGSLNVFIGPNGSGKTTLLEVFGLLARGVRKQLKDSISNQGGLLGLRSVGGKPNDPLSIELSVGAYNYAIELKTLGQGYVIDRELLTVKKKILLDRTATKALYRKGNKLVGAQKDQKKAGAAKGTEGFDEAELLLAQVPTWNEKELDEFRFLIGSFAEFITFYAGFAANVRLPQILEPGWLMPGIDGSKLVPALNNIKSSYPDAYQRIFETLQVAFPDLKDLTFPPVSFGQALLRWWENNERGFFHSQLSEGTLRFLCLVTMLLSPALPPLVVIDEPEVSMHPEMLMILAGLLKEASLRSQILVATHSERLIRWLEPKHVVICNKEDGFARLVRADSAELNLKDWLQKYTLDQLWLMGELGGRP
ncbi:MAG: hypothetical protein C4523_00485 [Myxococcales bacterium]|nr:MAG: hypothetical protein C4523_00485 [Myxococcales bacterium]